MIIVMGVPGAGKSSVLAGIKGHEIVNYGTLMFEIAKEKFGIGDRDQMRKLPIGQQKEVQATVAERLSSMGGKVVLDTHCSIKTPKGYLPGLPYSLLEKLDVEGLVLITAKPEDIAARRSVDPGRVRDEEGLEELREHDLINKALLASYAAHRGAPALIIYNAQGRLAEAVSQLKELFGE